MTNPINFYIIGNSLIEKVYNKEGLSFSTDLSYPQLLERDFKVRQFWKENNPIIACVARLIDWDVESDSVIVIHAGCGELVPIGRKTNVKWLLSSYESLDKQNPEAVYFYETIRKYDRMRKNCEYMPEDTFLESCIRARSALDKIEVRKKVVIGIGFLPEDDWRYKRLYIANQIIEDTFGDLNFLNLFKEELSSLISGEHIHLTTEGHQYVYDYIKGII